MTETRKLAAILVADVVGYSRLAGADEERTLARLWGLRSDLIDPAVAAHHSRIVKGAGDGIIIEFRSAIQLMSQCGATPRPVRRSTQFRVNCHRSDSFGAMISTPGK